VQYGKESNRPGVRGTLTSGRPHAHLGRTPWDISGESLGSRFALLSRPGSIQDSGSDLLPRDNNGRSHAGIPFLRLSLFVISVVSRAVRISIPANRRSRNFEH
jgi:hypothetical protein